MPARNIQGQNVDALPGNDGERAPIEGDHGKEYVLMQTSTVAEKLAGQSDITATRDRKVAVRREVRAALKRMRGRRRRSQLVVEAILGHPLWKKARVVAVFAPMGSEPDIELLWPHSEGKTFCYPTIRLGGLDFLSVPAVAEVVPGPYGFREPSFDPSRVVSPESFDLVLVPGSAFTVEGDRLGRGGGFYDRLLSAPGFRAATAGVCFDLQIYPSLPVEPHDQRVDSVVTESGWLLSARRKGRS